MKLNNTHRKSSRVFKKSLITLSFQPLKVKKRLALSPPWRRGVLGVIAALLALMPAGLPAGAVSESNVTSARGATQSERAGQAPPSLQRATAAVQPPTIAPECPATIRCVIAPAAYQANGGNPVDYGNYDVANRPHDMNIDSIIIHDGEGTCEDIIDAFRNPTHYASSQYVVCKDGTVYQMVRNQDLPWHAGNWWYNMHSIGIEHEGHAALGTTEYTPAMYLASAQLVKYLTERFSIPRDRDHIIGHDNVPGPRASLLPSMHTDPGPYWNWGLYMNFITSKPTMPSWNVTGKQVMIAPLWSLHKPPVTGCSAGENGCAPTQPQPASFVYLRTEPHLNAPLFTDPVLGQGTTDIKNNAARVFWGQKFMVADRRISDGGVWYKIWVNGSTGWFHSPWHAPTAAQPEPTEYVTPKASLSAPVYGRPSPELATYPLELLAIPPSSFWIPTLAPADPLPYRMQPGQKYRLISKQVVNDHFYAWAIDASYPYDHTLFKGKSVYYQVEFGGRVGFVRASDVVIR
ncbi:MAG TPA: peptidoglycan recognition family protein [Candidatus Saccharimonadales bacterium]